MKEDRNDLIKNIRKCGKNYNLRCFDTSKGVLVYNGAEYFLIKLKKDKVRKLYHQNYKKNAKTGTELRIEASDINEDYVKKCFHVQDWDNSDMSETLFYIKNHGSARRKYTQQRQAVLAMFA